MSKNKSKSGLSKMHQRVNDAAKAKVALNENKFWDDCNKHYELSTQAIHNVEGGLAHDLDRIVNTPELISQIKDIQGLTDNVNLLRKDLNEHVERLNTIHDQHKDKTGGISTPEEGVEVIQINGQYAEAAEIYNANVLPTVCAIVELIEPASRLISSKLAEEQAKAKQEADLLNPNVISDVVVKGE